MKDCAMCEALGIPEDKRPMVVEQRKELTKLICKGTMSEAIAIIVIWRAFTVFARALVSQIGEV